MGARAPMRETTAILGYGRFGRAMAELILDAGLEVRAWDPIAEVPAELRASSPADLVQDASRIILAVPVHAIREAALALRPHLPADSLTLDVSSVKRRPLLELEEVLGRRFTWVGTHPLFGSTSIALGERPLMAVVCPNPLHPEAAAIATRFYERIGCRVVEQDPDEHDRGMALTHALAFFVAKGMIDIGVMESVPFAPPSFQAMAHTVESVRADASHLFRSIQTDNPFAAEARERLLGALGEIHRDLSASTTAGPVLGRAPDIPDMGDRAPDLREIRDLIDDTDRELVRLLAQRDQLTHRAGRVKAREKRPIQDPQRERDMMVERRRWAEQEGMDPQTVEELFRSILRVSRSVQRGDPQEPR